MMQQIEARIRICRGGGGEQKRKSKRHVPEVVALAPQLLLLAFHLFLFTFFLIFFLEATVYIVHVPEVVALAPQLLFLAFHLFAYIVDLRHRV
jgi:hypothetical protein